MRQSSLQSSRIRTHNRVVNIDGIPRRVGPSREFRRALFLTMAFGIISFCCMYKHHTSIATRMGAVSGLGCLKLISKFFTLFVLLISIYF